MEAMAPDSRPKKQIKFIDEICQVIKENGTARKGVSYLKICQHILSKYDEAHHKRIRGRIRKTLVTGLESGVLTRPKSSMAAVGATGFFAVSKTSKQQRSVKTTRGPISSATVGEHVSDSEAIPNIRKKLPRSLSDSFITSNSQTARIKGRAQIRKPRVATEQPGVAGSSKQIKETSGKKGSKTENKKRKATPRKITSSKMTKARKEKTATSSKKANRVTSKSAKPSGKISLYKSPGTSELKSIPKKAKAVKKPASVSKA